MKTNFLFQIGPFTVFGGVEGLAFVKTKFANASEDWPDIEFHIVSGSQASDGGKQLRKIAGLNEVVSYHIQNFIFIVEKLKTIFTYFLIKF